MRSEAVNFIQHRPLSADALRQSECRIMYMQIAKDKNSLNKQVQEYNYIVTQVYATQNGINSMRQWFQHHDVRKGGTPTPPNIPSDPSKSFKLSGEWRGWSEFLGVCAQVSISELKSMPISDVAINDKTITLDHFVSATMRSPSAAFVGGNYVNKTENLLYPKRTVNVPLQLMRGGL
ncbi:TPA: hypothetical protein ACGSTL_001440 [Vibrio parahaemolyticus]|uniref:hypothetical protein n=1 Tax=Vibrio campbellii TaxID=680 RepID=UPI001F0813B0|nr:hypothetical protein [Vibrio campbellii]UMM06571.1 hypothetical protein MKR81_26860 [Vibrio campbellii]